jgi:hypothetical protein
MTLTGATDGEGRSFYFRAHLTMERTPVHACQRLIQLGQPTWFQT